MKDKEQPLPWTGGWRKIYAEAAEKRGYRCSWGYGGLLISTAEGRRLAAVKPLKSPFKISELIAQAILENRRERARRKREEIARQKFLEEIRSEDSPRKTLGPRVSSRLATASLIAAMAGLSMSADGKLHPRG